MNMLLAGTAHDLQVNSGKVANRSQHRYHLHLIDKRRCVASDASSFDFLYGS
jgi:hypothetical protein